MVLYSDNTNVVAWLGYPTVCTVVIAIKRIRYEYLLKLSVRHIPSAQNRTVDLLSRNHIPRWLRHRDTRRTVPPDLVDALNPFRLPGTVMVKYNYTIIKPGPRNCCPLLGIRQKIDDLFLAEVAIFLYKRPGEFNL